MDKKQKFQTLNYRHLYYFWMTAKEGSVTRAAEQLGVSVQTVSMQVSQFERDVGRMLFNQQGRRLVLTETGRLVREYADQIFMLGEKLRDELRAEKPGSTVRLIVGVSDSLSKFVIQKLLKPALAMPDLRLEIRESDYEILLTELALHKLDVVLGQKPADLSDNMRFRNFQLSAVDVSLFGPVGMAEKYREGFPQSLNGAPMLLPTKNHAVRLRLDRWLNENEIRPQIVGEFSDSALMKTFASHGMGLFHAPSSLENEMFEHYKSVPVGKMNGMEEKYFAVCPDQRIRHPAVELILAGSNVKQLGANDD